MPGGPGFPPPYPPRRGGGSTLVWLLVVGAVLVVAVAGTFAVLVFSGDDDDPARPVTLPSTTRLPSYGSSTEPTVPSPTYSSGGAVDPAGVLKRTITTAKGNVFTQINFGRSLRARSRTWSMSTRPVSARTS
ncbi:hypothetical protein AB0C69_37990 [Actinomadura sp. NPDC048032]|uniref:hypothetical protein n=1 Tax=Actinomadura sp. NPDC048032 TaxID=3155747 RepID=UPI00340A5FC6